MKFLIDLLKNDRVQLELGLSDKQAHVYIQHLLGFSKQYIAQEMGYQPPYIGKLHKQAHRKINGQFSAQKILEYLPNADPYVNLCKLWQQSSCPDMNQEQLEEYERGLQAAKAWQMAQEPKERKEAIERAKKRRVSASKKYKETVETVNQEIAKKAS